MASNEKEVKIISDWVKEEKVVVTRANAKEILRQLIKVIGKEDKGFHASRLTQCLNKLK